MDTCSSGEDLAIKTRKPYTITKQRERWTEEEHNRFLEALKLYGRAWQRIEEHIGSKTAVQIRSHAQKFFSKLEKEALAKGVPVGQAIDIEIPPPRPKRKPNAPYPRKTGTVAAPSTQVGVTDGTQVTPGSSRPSEEALDLEKEPLLEKTPQDGGTEDTENENGGDDCSEFTIHQEAPLSSGAKDSCNSREFVPLAKPVLNKDRLNESHITDGPNRSCSSSEVVAMSTLQQNSGSESVKQGTKNFPRHVPVHVLDGSERSCSHQAPSSDISCQGSGYQQLQPVHTHPALLTNPATSESPATTSRPANHQTFPSFNLPFHPFHVTQQDTSSLLQMSSTLSSLIVSTLLQNPAAHAAATFAATFWPTTTMEAPTDPHQGANSGCAPKPSMAAIAAATVAAATAWWAVHGLLPICPPVQASFASPLTTAAAAAPPSTCQDCQPTEAEKEKESMGNVENLTSQAQDSATSASDSGSKANASLAPTDHGKNDEAVAEAKDASKNKNRKRVDRSSCGSNSSSDLETNPSKKHEKSKEDNNEDDASQAAAIESISGRRSRNPSSSIDAWKEVSEEGRMAFQALFLREVLPQSFSPPPDAVNKANHNKKKNNNNNSVEENRQNVEDSNDGTPQLDLNSSTLESCSSHHEPEKIRLAEDTKATEGLLAFPLGQTNLKARKTGFKPYKRCSVEARESRVASTSSQDQEKCAKRARVGDEASN